MDANRELPVPKKLSYMKPLEHTFVPHRNGIDQPYSKLLALATRITQTRQAALFHLDRKIGALWLVATLEDRGLPASYWEAAHEVAEYATPLLFQPLERQHPSPVLAIPMELRSEFFGVLLIGDREEQPLNQKDLELATLLSEVISQNLSLYAHQLESVKALVRSLEARDPYTGQHSARVTKMALSFGRYLGLPPEELESLETASYLHDVGKVGIGDAILLKPEPFTAEEWQIIRRHPVIGEKIVQPLGLKPQETDLILHHHERWDGRGYPHGLSGHELSHLCTIVSLADCYDALTTDRPYRCRRPLREAVQEIQDSAGTQFNPELAREFIEMITVENRYNSYLFS